MRYTVRSHRWKAGGALYYLALIEPVDRARPAMLVRHWKNRHGNECVVSVSRTAAQRGQLLEQYQKTRMEKRDSGKYQDESPDFILTDFDGVGLMTEHVRWIFEIAKRKEVVAYLRFGEQVDPTGGDGEVRMFLDFLNRIGGSSGLNPNYQEAAEGNPIPVGRPAAITVDLGADMEDFGAWG